MQNNSKPVAKRWGTKRIIKYVLLTPIVLFVAFLLGYYFVYTPIAKFFDRQNFLAAERDSDVNEMLEEAGMPLMRFGDICNLTQNIVRSQIYEILPDIFVPSRTYIVNRHKA